MSRRIRLGESLVDSGLITQPQLDEALKRRLTTGERIGEALVALGFIRRRDLLRTLAQDADIPFLEGPELVVDPTVAGHVSASLARSQHVLPLRMESKALLVAMGNPFDVGVIRSLEQSTGRHVRVAAADPAELAQIVESIYGTGGSQAAAGEWSGGDSEATEVADDIIERGISMGATDIHIEPLADSLRIRYRIDGRLQDGPAYPKALQPSVLSRIKGLSSLDSGETRLPQDGRVRTRVDGRSIDLRISILPTIHGEDTVVRVLDAGAAILELDSLGISADDIGLLRSALDKPFGLLPVTGPMGSGKTTTLYAALRAMNTGERCLTTLEDPVECEIAGIRQSQIDARTGLTFASGLRSMLRHDPDVILVGEMRDEETAQIALSAALTNHLVLTTLRTATAAGVISRLLDMGAEPFVVGAAISLIVSQRLVRTLCEDCRTVAEVPEHVRKRFGLDDATVFRSGGCNRCRNSGFTGRIGIFEFLPISNEIVSAVYERRSSEEIRRLAARPTLLDDGIKKVRAGLTTLDEVLRVTA